MEFTRCPYDASPIEAQTSPGRPTLLSCSKCGAAWEWDQTRLRRIHEPDRAAVRRAHSADAPAQVIRSSPDPALAAAMWREVRSLSRS